MMQADTLEAVRIWVEARSGRTAPLGYLWATPNVVLERADWVFSTQTELKKAQEARSKAGGFGVLVEYPRWVVSQEYALDHGAGATDVEAYPSWPQYPDARNLPVAVAAREAFRQRMALREKKYACQKCGEDHLTARYPWHDETSREKDLLTIAEANSITVAEVKKRLEPWKPTGQKGKSQPVKEPTGSQIPIGVTPTGVTQPVNRCEVCNKPLRQRTHAGGKTQRFCSDACRQAQRAGQ